MKKKDFIETFKQFLRNKGIAAQFYVNCIICRRALSKNPIKSVDKYLHETDPKRFLVDSFIWRDSTEGFRFWNDLQVDWKRLFKTL